MENTARQNTYINNDINLYNTYTTTKTAHIKTKNELQQKVRIHLHVGR